MPRRVIVVFPTLQSAEVSSLRQQFDPLVEHVAPHVTLVSPFASDLSALELRRHIEQVVAGIAPFRLRLAGITGSEDRYLFLNVKHGNDYLIALRDHLYSGPLRPHLSVAHTYIPHLTVGQISDPIGFGPALMIATATDICIDTIVQAVSVYRIEPNGARPIESEIPLRPDPIQIV